MCVQQARVIRIQHSSCKLLIQMERPKSYLQWHAFLLRVLCEHKHISIKFLEGLWILQCSDKTGHFDPQLLSRIDPMLIKDDVERVQLARSDVVFFFSDHTYANDHGAVGRYTYPNFAIPLVHSSLVKIAT